MRLSYLSTFLVRKWRLERLPRDTSDHITMLCGASAAKVDFSWEGSYKFDGPDDAIYAKSESGWIDTELFIAWMNKVFLKFCGSQRPVIHSSMAMPAMSTLM